MVEAVKLVGDDRKKIVELLENKTIEQVDGRIATIRRQLAKNANWKDADVLGIFKERKHEYHFWTKEEHEKFIDAVREVGNKTKKIAVMVGTKTP